MICPNCKNTLNEGMTFCTYCGINLGNALNQMSQQTLNTNHSNKKNNQVFIALAVVIVLVILGVVVANIFVKKNVHTENNVEITTGDITGKVDKNTNLTYDASGSFLMYIEDILYPSDGSVMVRVCSFFRGCEGEQKTYIIPLYLGDSDVLVTQLDRVTTS